MSEDTKKIKILIVDSDEMMRIYFRDIFWIHGRSGQYEVVMASTIEEAEKLVFDINTRPDTIFGVTFMVVSAQHSRLMELVTPAQKKEVEKFLKKLKFQLN